MLCFLLKCKAQPPWVSEGSASQFSPHIQAPGPGGGQGNHESREEGCGSTEKYGCACGTAGGEKPCLLGRQPLAPGLTSAPETAEDTSWNQDWGPSGTKPL